MNLLLIYLQAPFFEWFLLQWRYVPEAVSVPIEEGSLPGCDAYLVRLSRLHRCLASSTNQNLKLQLLEGAC